MGKTYLWIRDGDSSSPEPSGDSGPIEFSVYNDAMSYAKFLSVRNVVSGSTLLSIWNYDGGSGYWINGSWTALENSNYPS